MYYLIIVFSYKLLVVF